MLFCTGVPVSTILNRDLSIGIVVGRVCVSSFRRNMFRQIGVNRSSKCTGKIVCQNIALILISCIHLDGINKKL